MAIESVGVAMNKAAIKIIMESAERKGMVKNIIKSGVQCLKKDGLLGILDLVWGESTPEERREWLTKTVAECVSKSAAEMVNKKMA